MAGPSITLFFVLIALSFTRITSNTERFCKTYENRFNKARIAFYSPRYEMFEQQVTFCFIGNDYYVIRETSTDLVLTNELLPNVSPLANSAYTLRMEALSTLSGFKMVAYNRRNKTLHLFDKSFNKIIGLKVTNFDLAHYSLAFNTNKPYGTYGFMALNRTSGLYEREFVETYIEYNDKKKKVNFGRIDLDQRLNGLNNINKAYEVLGIVILDRQNIPNEGIFVIIRKNNTIMYYKCIREECIEGKLKTLVDCDQPLKWTTQVTTQEPNESRRLIILIAIIGVIIVAIICLLLLCVICVRKCYLDRKRMVKKVATVKPTRELVLINTVDSQTGEPLDKTKSSKPISSAKTSKKSSSPKKKN